MIKLNEGLIFTKVSTVRASITSITDSKTTSTFLRER